jgi:hypothetical protein
MVVRSGIDATGATHGGREVRGVGTRGGTGNPRSTAVQPTHGRAAAVSSRALRDSVVAPRFGRSYHLPPLGSVVAATWVPPWRLDASPVLRGQPGVDDRAPELAVQVHNGVLALGRRDQRRQPGLPSVLPYVMSWRIGRVCGLGLASLQLWRRPASMDRRLACEAQLPRLSSRTCENSGAALPGARADRMIIAPVPST